MIENELWSHLIDQTPIMKQLNNKCESYFDRNASFKQQFSQFNKKIVKQRKIEELNFMRRIRSRNLITNLKERRNSFSKSRKYLLICLIGTILLSLLVSSIIIPLFGN